MAYRAFLLGGIAALMLAVPPHAAQADTISIRADVWCPYNCDPDSDMPGYGIEVAKEIFAQAGHTIDYKTMAWPRAIDECRKGNVNAIIGAAESEVPDFVFPAEMIAVTDNTFVVKKGSSWRYDGPDSLAVIKLGAIKSYAYGGEVGEYVESHAKDRKHLDLISGDNALIQNLKKVQAGRVAATVDSLPVLSYRLKQMGIADKFDFVGSVDNSENFIAFSPNNPKSKSYATLLEQGIAKMRASGRLQQILDRYGVKDWK